MKDKVLRYIGKVKKIEGREGNFVTIMMDNPREKKSDGTKDPYFKGQLIWLDVETKKKYLVKGFFVRGVSDGAKQKGFLQSIGIDLNNEYDCEEIVTK